MKEAALESTVLIVDDEEDILLTLKMLLKSKVSHLYTESNPYHLPRLLRQYEPDLVLLDLNFNKGAIKGEEGLHWLGKIKEIRPQTQVIVITAHGDIEIAVRALKVGAVDFLEKPWRNEKLLSAVQSALNLSLSKREIKQLQQTRLALNEQLLQQSGDILGESPAMQDVFRTIEKVAATEANVLILGENGTGKEMVARAIHRASSRHKEVFINVDLGSIPESLLESELFGHKKGAFTDAREDRIGRFQSAHGGTLFLDEIGNLSLASQSKLLSAIQNKSIVPVGANQPVPVDLRLISATNMPLHEMVQQKTFRQDLLYRINTVAIQLPPLRERIGDIPILANHFLDQNARKYQKPDLVLAPEALQKLEMHDWPGNVRELRHVIERAVILADTHTLMAEDILLQKEGINQPLDDDQSLNLDHMERQYVLKALRIHKGNITRAAEELGLTRAALYRRLEKFGLS
ncbi:MAG: sigma-54-dependent Fis family transcriptional regulator [Saprospiraceae bacterium]|nr:sigma-54-dependent Fis family transcriptional regulator [Saprospiraceae bacterium]